MNISSARLPVLLLGLAAAACSSDRGGDGGSSSGDCDFLAGDLVITEVMANPAGQDTGLEYFEVYNASSETIEAGGLTLVYSLADGEDEKTHEVEELSIEPGDYVTLGTADPEALPDFIGYGFANDLGALRNGGAVLALRCGDDGDRPHRVRQRRGRGRRGLEPRRRHHAGSHRQRRSGELLRRHHRVRRGHVRHPGRRQRAVHAGGRPRQLHRRGRRARRCRAGRGRSRHQRAHGVAQRYGRRAGMVRDLRGDRRQPQRRDRAARRRRARGHHRDGRLRAPGRWRVRGAGALRRFGRQRRPAGGRRHVRLHHGGGRCHLHRRGRGGA